VTASTSPTPTTTPPCRSDPDRWFDRAGRTHALAACLACQARSWCAREALGAKAAWGMWAGIWIDGDLADVEHYLRAIADDAPSTAPPPPANIHRRAPPLARALVIIRPSAAEHNVAALITARSGGHCEILASGCRLDLAAIASRIHGRCGHELTNSADGYAVCGSCQASVAIMEPLLARRLGYILDDVVTPAAVPFYWRQRHWMRFDPAGGAAPISSAERTA
jgi:hypothetical protein